MTVCTLGEGGGRRGYINPDVHRLSSPPHTLQLLLSVRRPALLPSAGRAAASVCTLARGPVFDADADCDWLLLHTQPQGYTFISW